MIVPARDDASLTTNISAITSLMNNDEAFLTKMPVLMRQDSVIARKAKRSNKDNPRGNEKLLLSRYNMSTKLTRTLGDVFGPRSCIAVPEIMSITIKPREYAR